MRILLTCILALAIWLALPCAAEEHDSRTVEEILFAVANRKDDDAVSREIQTLIDRRSIDPISVTFLIKEIHSGDWLVRVLAAISLGKTQDERAVRPLIEFLPKTNICEGFSDDDVAMSALVDLGAPAVEPLIDSLSSPNPKLRARAARTLGLIHDRRAVEPLAAALGDSLFVVRYHAAIALAGLADPRSLETLEISSAMEVPKLDYGVVAPYLSEIRYQEGSWDERLLPYESFSAIGRLGTPNAVAFLAEQLQKPDVKTRVLAANALGKVRNGAIFDPLVTALHDPDESVRTASSAALGQLHDRRVVEPMLALLGSSKDINTLVTAIAVLNEFHDPREIPALIQLLASSPLRDDAVQPPLISFGPAAVEPLLQTLNSSNDHLRLGAAETLIGIGDPRAYGAFRSALQHRDLAVVAGAYSFLIDSANPDTFPVFAQAIDKFGSYGMAHTFILSKREPLVKAGKAWIAKHPGSTPGAYD